MAFVFGSLRIAAVGNEHSYLYLFESFIANMCSAFISSSAVESQIAISGRILLGNGGGAVANAIRSKPIGSNKRVRWACPDAGPQNSEAAASSQKQVPKDKVLHRELLRGAGTLCKVV